MDLVHHLIFKESVLGTEDFQKTDKGQNPVLISAMYDCQNPLELNSNEFHFKGPTVICCLTILQQRTVLINIIIINIITWTQTQFCISGGEPSHSPWCPSHISDVPATFLGFTVLHTEYETSSKTQSGDKS